MLSGNMFSIIDFAFGISEAIDFVSPDLNEHHKKAAYISYKIAMEMDLPDDEMRNIVLAATLHDIGSFTCNKQSDVHFAHLGDNEMNEHPMMGYKLLSGFTPFAEAAKMIKYHHSNYDKSAKDIPMGSYIIHLADKLTIKLDKSREILEQVPEILASIEKEKSILHPDVLAAFYRVAKMEYFWIDINSPQINTDIPESIRFPQRITDIGALIGLAKIVAQIIDFRSRFTATHSSGVAAVAAELAVISGFSEEECYLMKVAGYLHDIGKLAISDDILEKNGALNHEEFNAMRKHSYITYCILSKIKGFEQIAVWASYHHEKLNGSGYPFHVKGENFNKLARIMAVADIVTAITEDRPYRLGMDGERAIGILYDMVEKGEIDKGTVDIVKENFTRISDVRVKAQRDALKEYDFFYSCPEDRINN